MQGGREGGRGRGRELRVTTSPLSLFLCFFFFPLLVFQASETPPCVRLHPVPWAAQAWRSVLKVSGRPCPVADTGYKLPARPSEKPWRMCSLHFYSNPTKVWLRSRSPSAASLIPSWLSAPAVLIGVDLSMVLK